MKRYQFPQPLDLRRIFGERDLRAGDPDRLLEKQWRSRVWLNNRRRAAERAIAEQMEILP